MSFFERQPYRQHVAEPTFAVNRVQGIQFFNRLAHVRDDRQYSPASPGEAVAWEIVFAEALGRWRERTIVGPLDAPSSRPGWLPSAIVKLTSPPSLICQACRRLAEFLSTAR
ncbi:MAG: hypothetical protein ABSF67_07995 [Roseiarcus sp.]|jgi:hypothetical protein